MENLIKIVTVIRKCGKSTLFDLYTEYLLSELSNDRKISVPIVEKYLEALVELII